MHKAVRLPCGVCYNKEKTTNHKTMDSILLDAYQLLPQKIYCYDKLIW